MAEGVELNVNDENWEKLRCSVCEGYLMCSPIRLLPDGHNLCGRCSPLNDNIKTYRNTALEAVLEGAVFPCRFKGKGCTKRLAFVSDSSHEDSCTYNTAVANVNRQIKSSSSTCAQDDFPASTSRDDGVFAAPKAGRIASVDASVCADDTAGGSNWNENTGRNSPANTSSNFDLGRTRASSSASNRSQNLNWNQRRPTPFRGRSYPNYVGNGHHWQSPWIDNGQGRHINMYKRRNNLIIIKGGTFYVNW